MPTVIELAQQYRRALERMNVDSVVRMGRVYAGIYDNLIGLLNELMLSFEIAPTETALLRSSLYKNSMETVLRELEKFSAYVELEAGGLAREAVTLGQNNAIGLVQNIAGIKVPLRTLNPAALETIVGFLSEGSPLTERIKSIAPQTTELVKQELINGIVLGKNPRVTAKILQRQFGVGLTQAMTETRTAQIYTYREANRASYIANQDVVPGWYWNSALQPGRTCMSCVNMHGTFHTNDEVLNDHYNGLCTMIPAVKGFPNPIEQTGDEWFSGQSTGTQKQMLGAKYDDWESGRIGISDMTHEMEDPTYGIMRSEASLKSILGGL